MTENCKIARFKTEIHMQEDIVHDLFAYRETPCRLNKF